MLMRFFKRKLNLFYFLILFGFVPASSQTFPHLKFAIADQFDSLHTEKEYPGTVTILVGSDRTGSQFNRIWEGAIRDSLRNQFDSTQVKILRVANVSSVPFFLKGLVKGKFPQDNNERVLLDWKGYFPKAYGFVEDVCNIVIFDGNGAVVYKTSAQGIDNKKLSEVCDRILRIVPRPRH